MPLLQKIRDERGQPGQRGDEEGECHRVDWRTMRQMDPREYRHAGQITQMQVMQPKEWYTAEPARGGSHLHLRREAQVQVPDGPGMAPEMREKKKDERKKRNSRGKKAKKTNKQTNNKQKTKQRSFSL